MSEFENQDAKAKEDLQPSVAPAAIEQASPDRPAALSNDQENVIRNLQVLDGGDHKNLAKVLADNPQIRERIIEHAMGHFGNVVIAKALAVVAGVPEPEAPSAKAAEAPATPAAAPANAKDETFDYATSPLALEYDAKAKVADHVDVMRANPAVADQVLVQAAVVNAALATEALVKLAAAPARPEAAPAREETPPQVIEETSKAAVDAAPRQEHRTGPAEPVTALEAVAPPKKAAPEPEKDAGWVVRAREFNADNARAVAKFMAATGGACMIDGALDPNLVAQWQSRHGVAVNGRISHDTIGAAIKKQPQTFAEATKEAAEEALPEPDPNDPHFGK